MDRLSEQYHSPACGHPQDFLTCWICGKRHDDICELDMWQECDDQDKPEKKYIIACRRMKKEKKKESCEKVITDHDRLYVQVPWAGDQPGILMLQCENCTKRREFNCTDPRTKKNGGEGLLITGSKPFGDAIMCTGKGCIQLPPVFNKCEGFEEVLPCRVL